MGCCQSTDSSPYDREDRDAAALPNSSNVHPRPQDSRVVTSQPQRSLSNADTTTSAPKALPNQPIRPPTPLPHSPSHVSKDPPPWTRRIIDREREAFFDTRVSGHAEVWKALRVVCEMLRRGDVGEAQGILDAMGMTCPNGRVARGRGRGREKGGVYDERGVLYDIPPWVLTDPEDIVEDDGKEEMEEEEEDDDEDEDGSDVIAAVGRRKEAKGKGRAEDLGEIVKVKARLSDRGTDVVVSVGMKQRVIDVVRAIRDQSGCKRVRLMYLGKTLDERSTLEESGWKQGHVINAMVFEGEEIMLSKKASK